VEPLVFFLKKKCDLLEDFRIVYLINRSHNNAYITAYFSLLQDLFHLKQQD
jgi:hypothetical protein